MCKIKPIPIFILRRVSIDDLNKLVDNVGSLSHVDGSHEYETAVYDLVRTFIFLNESFAKEIMNRSDLYLDWHEYYFEIQDNIIRYINNKLNKEWKI